MPSAWLQMQVRPHKPLAPLDMKSEPRGRPQIAPAYQTDSHCCPQGSQGSPVHTTKAQIQHAEDQ